MLKVRTVDDYHYIGQSGCTSVPGIDDKRDYDTMRSAMHVVGMSPEEQMQVLTIVAAALQTEADSTAAEVVVEALALQRLPKLPALRTRRGGRRGRRRCSPTPRSRWWRRSRRRPSWPRWTRRCAVGSRNSFRWRTATTPDSWRRPSARSRGARDEG